MLVVQNDVGNKHSSTIIVILLSTAKKKKLPIHVTIDNVMPRTSIVLAEQIRTIDNCRLLEYIGSLDQKIMKKVDKILRVSIGV